MKASSKTGLGLAALCISGQVWAQVPGYQVSWGTQGVPLSPWLNVLMVLMLALATYVFLRRRSGRGVTLLVGALAVGGLSLYADENAISVGPTDVINTPAGTMTVNCSTQHRLGTTVPGGVTLTVTPLASLPTGMPAAPSGMATECTTGLHLNEGQLCYLCLFG